MLRFFVSLYGFFFFLPLGFIPRVGFVKVDDLLLVFILAFFVISRGVNLNFLLCLLIVLCIVILKLTFSPMGIAQFEIVMRVIQCALVVLMASFVGPYRRDLVNGLLCGGAIVSMVFYYYFISNFKTDSLLLSLYAVKDYFMYVNDGIYSVHINTIMAIVMASFIFSFERYQYEKKRSYLFLMLFFIAILFVSVSKNAVLAIIFSFSIFYYVQVRSLTKVIVMSLMVLSLIPITTFVIKNIDTLELIASNRFEIYSTSFDLIVDDPFSSAGLGMQTKALSEATGLNYPAHNAILSIGLEFGFFYALFFLTALILLLSKTKGIYSILFLAFMFTGMFSNLLYFYKYHFFMLAIAWYFSLRVPKLDKRFSDNLH
jgi:hypothetical protein